MSEIKYIVRDWSYRPRLYKVVKETPKSFEAYESDWDDYTKFGRRTWRVSKSQVLFETTDLALAQQRIKAAVAEEESHKEKIDKLYEVEKAAEDARRAAVVEAKKAAIKVLCGGAQQ